MFQWWEVSTKTNSLGLKLAIALTTLKVTQKVVIISTPIIQVLMLAGATSWLSRYPTDCLRA